MQPAIKVELRLSVFLSSGYPAYNDYDFWVKEVVVVWCFGVWRCSKIYADSLDLILTLAVMFD